MMSQSEVTKVTLMGRHDDQHKRSIQQRADSLVPSCLSMKSDRSMEYPINFKTKQDLPNGRPMRQRSESLPSCLSMKTDCSMDYPMHFKTKQEIDNHEYFKPQSVQEHQTDIGSIFMLLEKNIIKFVRTELKRFPRLLSQEQPECLGNQREDEEEVDEEEEQRGISENHSGLPEETEAG